MVACRRTSAMHTVRRRATEPSMPVAPLPARQPHPTPPHWSMRNPGSRRWCRCADPRRCCAGCGTPTAALTTGDRLDASVHQYQHPTATSRGLATQPILTQARTLQWNTADSEARRPLLPTYDQPRRSGIRRQFPQPIAGSRLKNRLLRGAGRPAHATAFRFRRPADGHVQTQDLFLHRQGRLLLGPIERPCDQLAGTI